MPANHLIDETSPYLLQHAHNPVAWWPWGEEAIEKAQRDDRLIFLSIGYSTCYWCHVMERESFESEATARVMNERVVSIKVDREERPDLDEIYMTATQLLTGRGGWPMSVWLDPKTLRPVYAGTYFPPEPRHGLPSFEQVIIALSDAWRNDREALLRNASRLAEAVRESLEGGGGPVVAVGAPEISRAVNALMRSYDSRDGGFGSAPKFPQPAFLELLFAAREFLGDEARADVEAALRHTLDRMAMGGMHDHIGGGFHRYSTDAKWLVPHFEKMLYDNAQLASVYLRGFEVFGDPWYAEVARDTLEYVLREMNGPDGAFYSAQDAEVDAREGRNYLWTPAEVREALAAAGRNDLVDFAIRAYGLNGGTNFQDPHHPEEPASNVLFLSERPEKLSQSLGLRLDTFKQNLGVVNRILQAVRAKRKQPGTDDKVIASWNGLIIAALAEAGYTLGEIRFREAAADAALFIMQNMRDRDSGLLRTWRGGRAKVSAFAEDYAFFIRGLLALDRAQPEQPRWLEAAVELMARARERFGDVEVGGWHDTLCDQPDLFVRTKSFHDGAVPSANGIMLHNLLDLHERTGDATQLEDAIRGLGAASSAIAANPLGTAISTAALIRIAAGYPEKLSGDSGDSGDAVVGADGVAIRVDRDRIRVKTLGSGVLHVVLEIPAGSHINAHEPGDASLVGLLVHVIGGQGIVATAGYPPAEQWRGIQVHTGRIEIPVSFEQIAEVQGQPKVAVRWQTCTESECRPPQERTLDVRLVVEED